MDRLHETDPLSGELFLAGERVPAGTYRQIGGNREVLLATEDWLPASLDGRVACYERVVYAAVSVLNSGHRGDAKCKAETPCNTCSNGEK